jgi:ABC-type antimicrobial peptide transport system permease subunit
MLSTIQKLLLAFITLIIGLVLVGSVATSTQGATKTIGVSGETIDISGALVSVTTNVGNVSHGTKFSDSSSLYGTYILRSCERESPRL